MDEPSASSPQVIKAEHVNDNATSVVALPRTDLGRWQFAGRSPLAGLKFGMGVEEAWVVAPALRDAMRLTLAASEFLELRQRRPELVDRVSRNREEGWPIVDGASWELRFEHSRGLTMVTAKYPSEEALRAAIQSWGPSDIGARWDFWFDDKGTMRAAFTGCHASSDEPTACRLELMPSFPAESFVEQLFPDDVTIVGARPESIPWLLDELRLADGDARFVALPLPTSLWIPVHVKLEGTGVIRALRTALDSTYDAGATATYRQLLQTRVPNLTLGADCTEANCPLTGTSKGIRVEVKQVRSQTLVTLGDWEN